MKIAETEKPLRALCHECIPTRYVDLVDGVCPVCSTDHRELLSDPVYAYEANVEAEMMDRIFARDRNELTEAEEEAMADHAAAFEESRREARFEELRDQLGWLNVLINDHERLMEKLDIHGETDPDPSATAECYAACRALHADLKQNLELQAA